ncbi:MAG: cold shock domain-containing protein [Thermomicrobiales bacterium]
MATGTIKSLRDRGFGFITLPTDGGSTNELFFHANAVTDTSFDQLHEGQQVTFDQEPDPRDIPAPRSARAGRFQFRDANQRFRQGRLRDR